MAARAEIASSPAPAAVTPGAALAAAQRRAPARAGADPLGRRRGPALHRRRRPLGPGLHPAGAGGGRRDRAVGPAQSRGQPRPAGLGAHRRSRGDGLPRLRHPAARRAALSHRRPGQSLRAAAAGAGRDRRHHPVARQQHRPVAAHHRQHRAAGDLPSAAAVARSAARPAGHLSGGRVGGPHAHHPADHALWLAAGRGGAPDGRCAGSRRRRRSPASSACRRWVRWPPQPRTNSARRSRPSRWSPRRCCARSSPTIRCARMSSCLSAESDRCRAILARLSVDPAGDVSDAYMLVPLPALIEAAAQNYKREGIAIIFEAGPIGEGAPATAPIQVRSPEIMQGIGNIVQNAVSFARREVLIATRWTTEWSEVEVSDDGPGFSAGAAGRTGHTLHFDAPGRGRTHGIGRFHRQDATGTHRRHGHLRQPPGRRRRGGCPCAGQIPSSRLHSGRCRRSGHEPGHRRQPPRVARHCRRDDEQGSHLADRRRRRGVPQPDRARARAARLHRHRRSARSPRRWRRPRGRRPSPCST